MSADPTIVIHIRDRREDDVYIGREGKGEDGYFGNPFVLTQFNNGLARRASILKFKTYFLQRVETDPEFRKRVLELRGKRLACFCKPAACHGDVIAEWLDSQSEDQ